MMRGVLAPESSVIMDGQVKTPHVGVGVGREWLLGDGCGSFWVVGLLAGAIAVIMEGLWRLAGGFGG